MAIGPKTFSGGHGKVSIWILFALNPSPSITLERTCTDLEPGLSLCSEGVAAQDGE